MCAWYTVLSERLQQLRSAASREAAEEALAVFAPLANRLGVWSIKAELEDLAFKVGGPLGAQLPEGWMFAASVFGRLAADMH